MSARAGGRLAAVVMVVVLTIELVVGWPWLTATLEEFRVPHLGWFALAALAAVASMGAYARLQRRLLRAGGTSVTLPSAAALAYASHSLSDTLPGGPAFSTVFSFKRMRALGAPAGVASWAIALSGVISSAALIAIGVVAGLVATGSTDRLALAGYVVGGAGLVWAGRSLSRRPELLTNAATRGLAAANRLMGRRPERGRERVLGLVDELTSVRIGRRDLTYAATLGVVNWLLDAACLYLCLVAVGVESPPVVAVVLVYTAGMAALSVPLVPGGLGVVDGVLVLGLVAGGVSPADAIAAVILFRVITLGLIIGIGWVVWGFTRFPRQPGRQIAPPGASAWSRDARSAKVDVTRP